MKNGHDLNSAIQQMKNKIWPFIVKKDKKKELITSDTIKNFLKAKEMPITNFKKRSFLRCS